MLHSYPKVYSLGHKAIEDLFRDEVVVQEKVDGSQFSFGVNADGSLRCRSKEQSIDPENPPKMFEAAIVAIKARQWLMRPRTTYRAEYLSKPKHNVSTYDRVPKDNLILFDVDNGEESYADPDTLIAHGLSLGLEVVPSFYHGRVNNLEELMEHAQKLSVLGGVPCEGIVIKNYHRWAKDGKALMGKYVRPEFKEAHKKEWKVGENREDILQAIILTLKTPMRWEKAVQHLRDRNELKEEHADIGPLMKEVAQDVLSEEKEWIKDKLYQHFVKDITRGVTKGLPEWYKERLFLTMMLRHR